MTTPMQVVEKLQALSEEQQRCVLEFIEKLEQRPKQTLSDPYGVCADLRMDLPFEEFQKNRKEMWGDATDKEL